MKWEMVKWKDAISIQNGRSQKAVEHIEGQYPIYGSGGIMSGRAKDFLCPANTIIIGRKGTIDNPIFVEEPFWNVDTAFGLIPGNRLVPRFFYYFCQTVNFKKLNKATTLPSLTKSDLLELSVPLPPLAEQARIAAVLDAADQLRRADRALLSKYDALTQAVFYEMFGDPVKNEKGWEVKKLGEVVSMVGSGSTPKGGESVYTDNGYLFIRSQNVRNNSVDYKGIFHIPLKTHTQMKRTWVQNEDILLNITGASIGRAAIFYGPNNSANVNQHVCIIRLNQQSMIPQFLLYHLTNDSYQQKIIGQNAGGTREAFNFKQIRDFDLILPPLALQQSFAARVQAIESQKALAVEGLGRSEALMESLMGEVFGSSKPS